MEPMDTYLCVLLDLNLTTSSPVSPYTQTQICGIISDNQTSFDGIYNDPAARQAAKDEFMDEARRIIVFDKEQDCG